jgi:hypothetical protein
MQSKLTPHTFPIIWFIIVVAKPRPAILPGNLLWKGFRGLLHLPLCKDEPNKWMRSRRFAVDFTLNIDFYHGKRFCTSSTTVQKHGVIRAKKPLRLVNNG